MREGKVLKYVINGRFLSRGITGVERYAYEILLELDKLVSPDEVLLAVPKGVNKLPPLKNIQVKAVGRFQGILWEQISLPCFIVRNRAVGVHLCNVAPLVKPDIVCIHDMNTRANPWNFRKAFVLWYRLQFFFITHFGKQVITVSEFSKGEIKKYYPGIKKEPAVIGNGWQHMERIQEDNAIFDKLHINKDNPYFFVLSSMSPNKNLSWVLRAAEKYPEMTFVAAGKIDTKVFQVSHRGSLENVIYPGYISDGEAKALMRHCKAFLFPSFYEGFGIPPMEALSVGADIVISDIPVLHEIYGDAAVYVDPNGDGRFEIDPSVRENAKEILSKYSYGKSALILYRNVLRLCGW